MLYVEYLHGWRFYHKLHIKVPHMTRLVLDINQKMINSVFGCCYRKNKYKTYQKRPIVLLFLRINAHYESSIHLSSDCIYCVQLHSILQSVDGVQLYKEERSFSMQLIGKTLLYPLLYVILMILLNICYIQKYIISTHHR